MARQAQKCVLEGSRAGALLQGSQRIAAQHASCVDHGDAIREGDLFPDDITVLLFPLDGLAATRLAATPSESSARRFPASRSTTPPSTPMPS